jgi:hypothetical protein
MVGVTLGGPTNVYGGNVYVVHNTQHHESVLKKMSNSICYHAVCESAVPGGKKPNHFIRHLLHDL